MIFFLSPLTFVLMAMFTAISLFILWDRRNKKPSTLKIAPGPRGFPIIGSMHLLGKYDVPYKAFGDLGAEYGPIVTLQLGSMKCMVVNGQKHIREILLAKGAHFDSRPSFGRFHNLFDGDKENSLAFCDWSVKQKSRRDMLRAHTFPSSFSNRFHELDGIMGKEIMSMNDLMDSNTEGIVDLKPVILYTCFNIFSDYFGSKKFSANDVDFQELVRVYDEVFYEVNQGYAADFLPFLLPFHKRQMKVMANWSHNIRQFILKKIISDRFEKFDSNTPVNDYIDSLIDHVKHGKQPALEWNTALFALEDIIGGHSAIANLLVKILSFVVVNPEVQKKMQQEIDDIIQMKLNFDSGCESNDELDFDVFGDEHSIRFEEQDTIMDFNESDEISYTKIEKSEPKVVKETKISSEKTAKNKSMKNIKASEEIITLKDRSSMPYTEAVILEGIRLIASPIVPHVSNQESSVGDFFVPKNTLIFLNNYELNMSPKYWEDPESFKPERFIVGGRIQKPDHFLPFGGGKRSCMGYKLVQLIGFGVMANLLRSYTLTPAPNTSYKVPIGNLALAANQRFDFGFEKRM